MWVVEGGRWGDGTGFLEYPGRWRRVAPGWKVEWGTGWWCDAVLGVMAKSEKMKCVFLEKEAGFAVTLSI